jgi:short-subunit dehydrogenase
MRDPRTIVITGASSGIGQALALLYAAAGRHLLLTGRDRGRLEAVAAAVREREATVETTIVDVTDADGMAVWLTAMDSQTPIDLCIANAGISAGTGGGVEDAEQARRIFAVNVAGVMNSIHPLIPRMQARGRGQLALISSLAGFRGFPGAPAYCASKAAVRLYGEALRSDLAPHGIGVSVVCPGFVRSRMTAVNRFRMPMLMDSEQAAVIIQRGLAANQGRIAFPWPLYAFIRLLAALPGSLTDPLLARLPRKGQ